MHDKAAVDRAPAPTREDCWREFMLLAGRISYEHNKRRRAEGAAEMQAAG